MAPDPSRQPYRRVLHRSYRILTRNADMRYSAPSSDREWAGGPAPDGSNRPEIAKPVHGRHVRTGVRPRRGCPRVRRVEVGRFRSCWCRVPRVERSTGTRPPTVRARIDDSILWRTVFPACTPIRSTCADLNIQPVRRGRVNTTEFVRSASREETGSEDHDRTGGRTGESPAGRSGGRSTRRHFLAR